MNYGGRFAAHCGLPTGVDGRLEGSFDEVSIWIGRADTGWAGLAFFIWRWASSPYRMGGVMPSAKPLARAMARASMEARRGEGPVVELGAGTGSITQALIERGIGEQELMLIEQDREMCRWLKRRFPRAAVVRGEAAQIGVILAREFAGPASVVVSSLPLRNMQASECEAIVQASLDAVPEGGAFVQYTYARHPALACVRLGLECRKVGFAAMNMPPAGIWRIAKAGGARLSRDRHINGSSEGQRGQLHA